MVIKKVMVITGLVLLILITSFSSVMSMQEPFRINLFPKNSDWSIIENNANGWVKLNYAPKYGNQLEAMALGLKKYTFYTLVYTEENEKDSGKNTEVYCFDKRKTNNIGSLKIRIFEFRESSDNLKFWIVLSKDVDCRNNKMINWNPVSYLFSE